MKYMLWLFVPLLTACITQPQYYVPEKETVITQNAGKYIFTGEFKSSGRLDTVAVYIHSPANVIEVKYFVLNYHIELPAAEYYVVYFVNKYGTTKRMLIFNCGKTGFFYYTDVAFSGRESIMLFKRNSYSDVEEVSINMTDNDSYKQIISK